MRQVYFKIILLMLIVLVAAGCTDEGVQADQVQGALTGLFDAYNKKEKDIIKKYTAENCTYYWEDGSAIVNSSTSDEGLVGILSDRAKGSYTGTLRPREFNVDVYGDSALAEGYVYGMISTDTEVIAKGPWRTTTSWIRVEGIWRLTHAHFSRGVAMEYALSVPEAYGKEEKSWPVLVYLHGSDERGTDLDKVTMNGLPKLISEYAKQDRDFPFITISPQCPADKTWSQVTDQIINIIDNVSKNYKLDQNRIFISGLNHGGTGAYYTALKYPKRVAAIVAINGTVRDSDLEDLSYIKNIPVRAYLNKDEDGQRTIDALKKAGNRKVLESSLAVSGNDAISQVFDSPELIEWLLGQSKS